MLLAHGATLYRKNHLQSCLQIPDSLVGKHAAFEIMAFTLFLFDHMTVQVVVGSKRKEILQSSVCCMVIIKR